MALKKWAIFCLEKDAGLADLLQNKFYQLSQDRQLQIFVEYSDIVSLKPYSGVEDFKYAINSYFSNYV